MDASTEAKAATDAGRGGGRIRMPFAEFVALVGLSMAVTALSIDIMLVALPDISADFALADPNHRQFVLTAYLVAYAAGHLIAGPLSDRFGRRPVLLAGLSIYILASVAAAFAESFTALLIARVIQGLAGSCPRVVAGAVVRDCFSGRQMARVLSFAMALFIMVPVVAPAIGSVILLAAPWRTIFHFLAIAAFALAVWIFLRLPETNPPEARRAVDRPSLLGAVAVVFSHRVTVGYAIAIAFSFATIITYIATAQQMFADLFGVVAGLPIVFAIVALAQAAAAFLNANLVERFGMRRISHASLVMALAGSALVAVLAAAGHPPGLIGALAYLCLIFGCAGLAMPNFNAMAMEPLGRVAGTGASLIGFYMTAVGTLLGALLGQLYDGTFLTLALGYLAFAAGGLVVVFVTERGRLFAPQTGP